MESNEASSLFFVMFILFILNYSSLSVLSGVSTVIHITVFISVNSSIAVEPASRVPFLWIYPPKEGVSQRLSLMN